MGYYWTIIDDLPTEQIVVMRPGNLPAQTTMNTEKIENPQTQYKTMKAENGEYVFMWAIVYATSMFNNFNDNYTKSNLSYYINLNISKAYPAT